MRFQAPADDLPGWAQRLPFYYGWVIAGVSWLVIVVGGDGTPTKKLPCRRCCDG